MASSILHFPSSHVVVTGGAGFIGSHLVERLLTDGHRVVVIDDLSTGRLKNLGTVRRHPGFRLIKAKVSKCPGLDRLMSRTGFIFHLAATVGVELVVKSPIRVIETNLLETEAVLKAAAPYRVPMLLASTSEVYGKSRQPAFGEDDDLLIGPPGQSRWSYACSKLMDEFLALAYAREKSVPIIVARLFNTVGPRQTGRYGMVLPRFIAAARQNKPLKVFGDGRQTRCFCSVHDTVEALVRLQKRGCDALGPARKSAAKSTGPVFGQIFNVGSTEEISMLALARLVVKTLDSKSKIHLVPYDQAYAPGFDDMRRRKPMVKKLERLVNFRPRTTLREIIRLTAES